MIHEYIYIYMGIVVYSRMDDPDFRGMCNQAMGDLQDPMDPYFAGRFSETWP